MEIEEEEESIEVLEHPILLGWAITSFSLLSKFHGTLWAGHMPSTMTSFHIESSALEDNKKKTIHSICRAPHDPTKL